MTICAKNNKKEYTSLSEERRALLERKKIERTVEAFNNVREQTQAQQAAQQEQQNNQPQPQQNPQPQAPQAQNTENNQPSNKRYVFVRLLQMAYKEANAAAVLDKAIRLVDKKDQNTGLVYNHATCSATMLDGFYGLTLSGNKFALMKEFITKIGNKNKFMAKVDLKESIYALYAVEVDDDDWKNVKRQLSKFLSDPKLTYDCISIVFIGLEKIRQLITGMLAKFGGARSDEAGDVEEEKRAMSNKIRLVCSSFVAFMFYNYTKLKSQLNEKELRYTQISPTDLVSYLPNAQLLHCDKFVNYNKNCERYIAKHKEFKPFFMRNT